MCEADQTKAVLNRLLKVGCWYCWSGRCALLVGVRNLLSAPPVVMYCGKLMHCADWG